MDLGCFNFSVVFFCCFFWGGRGAVSFCWFVVLFGGMCFFRFLVFYFSTFKSSVKIPNLLLKELFHGKKPFLNMKFVNSELL